MGYTTEFQGEFKLNRGLTHQEWLDMRKLAEYNRAEYVIYTDTPETIPDSYNQWEPNESGTAIVWNGGEKFYDYVHWLRWIVKHYLRPHGLVIDGEVEWSGEEFDDRGVIVAIDNKITTRKVAIQGAVTCPNCNHRFAPENV